MRGLDIEKQKVDDKMVIETRKLDQTDDATKIDAQDTDLDRGARIRIAKINKEGRKSATGKS